MWGDSRSANRTGPFRGSQEERFAPGWNRDYPPPPLKSHAQERHSGNFPGRDSLPFDFQGHSGPPFANVEEHPFSYGARDGLLGDYPGGEGSGHDFRGGDFSSSDFQSRDSAQLDFRGRDIHSGDFRDREGPPLDYRGGSGTPVDYRSREPSHMNYRDREAHTVDFRGRDAPPSDFRGGRGAYDLDFRGRKGSHTDFRGRDLSDLDFRTRDRSRSDFRNRDVSDLDFRDKDGTQGDFRGRGSGTSDLDFRDRDAPHSDFRGRHRSRTDQDFRGRDVGACMEFKGREMPSVDPNILDYIQPSTQDREHSGMNVNKREESTHDHTAERPAFGAQKGELEHSETREGETQGVAFEQESSSDFQNSQSPLQDQDKAQPSGGDKQSSGSGLFKEEGGLDFLGRQDTDYRSMEYRDVDHRLPGGQLFGYGQSKSFPEGKPSRDGPQELQDQDYRTGPSEEKASKLIRLNGVPENATKEEILNAFRTPDDRPVKDLQLKGYNTGYDYGYVCVEFSLLEDAIGCMEANQVALYFGQMMLEGYIFMYGEGGFQVVKLWKGAKSSYLQHTTCHQKAMMRRNVQRAGRSSGRIRGRGVRLNPEPRHSGTLRRRQWVGMTGLERFLPRRVPEGLTQRTVLGVVISRNRPAQAFGVSALSRPRVKTADGNG